MQLIDIATTSIALFGAAYFLTALAAHLHHCWSNPHTIELARFDRQLATVEAIAPTVEPPLLLPPAVKSHPWELAVDKMLEVEPIAAVHQPAAAVEPLIELPPVEVAPHVEPDAPIDYQAMSSQQLRAICTQHGIKWRSVKAGKHLNKPEMISALLAV